MVDGHHDHPHNEATHEDQPAVACFLAATIRNERSAGQVNDLATRVGTLSQADVPRDLQARAYTAIGDIFVKAIDARAPAKRPPGKAGLRAEKAYYRLLYLEGEDRQRVAPAPQAGEAALHHWHHLESILSQLRDLPELKRQLIADIESALDDILSPV
jgi:hypothetical protein